LSQAKPIGVSITGLLETAVWILNRMAQLQRQTLLIDQDLQR
jgi:hypothetical protein